MFKYASNGKALFIFILRLLLLLLPLLLMISTVYPWQLNNPDNDNPEGRDELRNSINREPIYEWEGSQRDSLGTITYVTKVRLQHLPCQVRHCRSLSRMIHHGWPNACETRSAPSYLRKYTVEKSVGHETCFRTLGTFHTINKTSFTSGETQVTQTVFD